MANRRFPLGRRELIRTTGAALGLSGLGATTVSAASTDADQFTFYDDWEDGSYNSSPAWEIYRDEGDFSASIVSQQTPDGGNKTLEVSETTDGGTLGSLGWTSSYDGWDSSWSLQGLFYTESVPLNSDYQGHGLRMYTKPGTDSPPLALSLGFRDSDGNPKDVALDGDLIDTVDQRQSVDWQESTWYRYEVSHSGSGDYEVKFWKDSEKKPTSPTATSTGSAPGEESRAATIAINGAKHRDFKIRHANIGWKTDQIGYFGQYYNLSSNHPDMETPAASVPNTGRVRGTLPLRLTDRGKYAYEQFDWFDNPHRTKTSINKSLKFGADFFPVSTGKDGDPYHFAAHWTAEFDVRGEDSYSFATTSDDDSWVFVDGELIVDNGGQHATETVGSRTTLGPGTHTLDVFFAERRRSGSTFVFDLDDRLTAKVRKPDQNPDQGADLLSKAGEKADLIGKIKDINRDTASASSGGLFSDSTVDLIDDRAERYVSYVQDNAEDFTNEQRQQHTRALQTLLSVESASFQATKRPMKVARKTSGFLLKVAIMYATEKLGEAGKYLDDAGDKISSLPYVEDFTNSVGNLADYVFGTVKRHILDGISGTAAESVIDWMADFIGAVQREANKAMGDDDLRDVGKTAATKGITAGIGEVDSGLIGALKELFAEAQEEIARVLFDEYYFSENISITPLPTQYQLGQHIDDTNEIELGPTSIEPFEIPVPDPIEDLQEITMFEEIQENLDQYVPGGINSTMDERAGSVAAGAKEGTITAPQTDIAGQASSTTGTAVSLVSDACLFALDTAYDFADDIVSTVEKAFVVGGLLSYIAKRLSQTLLGTALAALVQSGITAALAALGKFMLVLTAIEMIIGQITLRLCALIHFLGTLAGINPAVYPQGSDAV